MKKLLSLLGSVGMIGTTSATVVSCKKDKAESNDPVEVAKKALQEETNKAKNLVKKGDAQDPATIALKKAIDQAQETLSKAGVTPKELNDAKANLTKAIEFFNKESDPVAVKAELDSDIVTAEDMISNNHKVKEAVEELKSAVAKAKEVSTKQEQPTLAELKTARKDLRDAIEKFNSAEENEIGKAKQALQTEITKAEELVANTTKEESVTRALETAILEAKKVFGKTDADEKQLNDAKAALTKAIEEFNKADDANVDVARKALKAEITKADELVKKAEKEAAAVAKLKTASDEAKKVADKKESTEQQLNEATTKLQKAITEYGKAANAKKTIEVDNSKPTVQVGKTISLKVKNASQIEGLSANGDDNKIGTIKHEGASDTIAITGVKAGTFKLILTGDNANRLELQVTVSAAK